MALKFSTTSAEVGDGGFKFLVYAPAGNGKTMLAATLPGNKLILSTENGLLSLSEANQMRIFGRAEDIPVIKIQSASDLSEAYEFVATSPYAKDVDSIALDSITDIAEVVLTHYKRTCKDPRKAYGEMQDKMTELIRKFRDLPGKHVMFTAKQDREKDQDGMMLYGPSMPGKTLTLSIAHFFDEVFALEISPKQADGSTYRFLRTRANIQFQAKDRSGALDEIEEPNLTNVIAKIRKN